MRTPSDCTSIIQRLLWSRMLKNGSLLTANPAYGRTTSTSCLNLGILCEGTYSNQRNIDDPLPYYRFVVPYCSTFQHPSIVMASVRSLVLFPGARSKRSSSLPVTYRQHRLLHVHVTSTVVIQFLKLEVAGINITRINSTTFLFILRIGSADVILFPILLLQRTLFKNQGSIHYGTNMSEPDFLTKRSVV